MLYIYYTFKSVEVKEIFIKLHCKNLKKVFFSLSSFMTKNKNGIQSQVYTRPTSNIRSFIPFPNQLNKNAKHDSYLFA